MREVGIVDKLEDGKAKVKVDKKDECSKCGMCLFSEGAKYVVFTCENKANAEVGDTVEIEITEKGKLRGVILVFLIPILLIGISSVVSLFLIKNEMWILYLSLIFVSVWFIVLSFIDKALKNKFGFIPSVIKIIKKGEIIK